MSSKDKPYRVYRGGRARAAKTPLSLSGKKRSKDLPAPAPLESGNGYPPGPPPEPGYPYPAPEPLPRRRRGRRILLWTILAVLILLLLVVGWGAAGYFSVRSGVKEANERLPQAASAALTPAEGSILSSPTNTLLIGADAGPGREGEGRSDSLVLVRTDPENHRVALLSIPRDLRVEIPGFGNDKVNAAYAYGGATLAVRTVEELTGLPVHHVVVVDFASFPELIDALGGVTIDVPKRIVSNKFDCPYGSEAKCERWDGWTFGAGTQTMDGRRALVYSRIRENQLDASESDITRGGRQQQVIQAMIDEIASPMGFLRLPLTGDDITKPLATDLSTNDFLRLGWVALRASDEASLKCRLGGVAEQIDGVFYLTGTEQNVAVISMFIGDSAPQPPSTSEGPFAPGCLSDS